MRKTRLLLTAAMALGIAAPGPALAELPEMTVKIIGLNSKTIVSFGDERPFWEETIPAASQGRIKGEYNPVDLMGVKDPQVMRMTTLGVVDFAAGDISKMAGDDPVFEGCDLAGLASDIETAKAACDAWLPVMDRVMREKFGVKMLAFGANQPQVFWCRDELAGLADLQGRKVRVFNKTITDFVTAVGGTAISMPFAEVVPALQRGVVDCAVTGTLSGNTAGWPEVAGYLYPLSMGWSINYQSANLEKWQSWSPEVQAFFEQQFAAFQDKMWDTVAKSTAEGIACNTGEGECTLGKPAKMTLVELTDADKAEQRELMQDVVLVEWGKRCGKDCAAEWNETVGRVVDLAIPLDRL